MFNVVIAPLQSLKQSQQEATIDRTFAQRKQGCGVGEVRRFKGQYGKMGKSKQLECSHHLQFNLILKAVHLPLLFFYFS